MTESAKMILLSDPLQALSTSSTVSEPLVPKRLGDQKSWCRYFWAREKSTALLDIKPQFLSCSAHRLITTPKQLS